MTSRAGSLSFSVIIASRGRPGMLSRTLRAVRQLDYPDFEVIVVGDSAARKAVKAGGFDWVRLVAFDEPNLALARNLGVAASAGDVCAFLDDDAVPEPTWLTHHAAALDLTFSDASVGFVRGRDGIRFQSRFETIGRDSLSYPQASDGTAPFLPDLPEDHAAKLVGTNMVIKRRVLLEMGGFDPEFRYFLEDGDLSMRLAKTGRRIAVAPLAQVHHALAASSRRRHPRIPITLFDIGRSSAIFLRRHGRDGLSPGLRSVLRLQRERLDRLLVQGFLEPRDIAGLMETLEAGIRDGTVCRLVSLRPLIVTGEEFHPIRPQASGHRLYRSRLTDRRSVVDRAEQEVADGRLRASVISFSLTSWRHSVRYTEGGVWLHIGGQFRSGDGFRWCRFASRLREEIARVAKIRAMDDVPLSLKGRDARL